MVAWGEFTATLEDVAVTFCSPLLVDQGTTNIVLSKEKGEDTAAIELCPQGVKQIDVHLLVGYFRDGEGR